MAPLNEVSIDAFDIAVASSYVITHQHVKSVVNICISCDDPPGEKLN